MLRLGAAALLWGSICLSPVFAAENPINDFTGTWARNSFNFEPIPGQPAPLVNLKRIADGTMDAGQIVGDYNNPILKPEAAETVRDGRFGWSLGRRHARHRHCGRRTRSLCHDRSLRSAGDEGAAPGGAIP